MSNQILKLSNNRKITIFWLISWLVLLFIDEQLVWKISISMELRLLQMHSTKNGPTFHKNMKKIDMVYSKKLVSADLYALFFGKKWIKKT